MRCFWPKLPEGPIGLGGLIILGFFALMAGSFMVLLIAAYIYAGIQLLIHGHI